MSARTLTSYLHGQTPNKTLQQTGHATDSSSGFDAPSRVSRLLSVAFGPWRLFSRDRRDILTI
jgi:hypothetical protein